MAKIFFMMRCFLVGLEKPVKKAELISAYNPLLGDNVPKPGEGPSKESRDSGATTCYLLE